MLHTEMIQAFQRGTLKGMEWAWGRGYNPDVTYCRVTEQ